MDRKKVLAVTLVVLALSIACFSMFALHVGPFGTGASDKEAKVLAFYYMWHESYNPYSGPSAWTDGSPYTPLLGVYNSLDPGVIKNHLAWAEYAGIDVLICSWWGKTDRTDSVLSTVFDVADDTGSDIQFSVYYEIVSSADSPEMLIENAVSDFDYLLERYGSSPFFFKVDGKPVVFVYNRAMNQLWDLWDEIIPEIRKQHDVLLIADYIIQGVFLPSQILLFDGIHHYNALLALDTMSPWQISGFFKDQVWTARHYDKISVLTVVPGFDETLISDRTQKSQVSRQDGKLYESLWQLAIKANPDWIAVTSFNEWYEATQIEPALEYGELYLQLTRTYSDQFRVSRP